MLKMKNFEEYLLFYQALDIKLLTDIWINFRDLCLSEFKLESGHFISSASMSF